MRLLLTVYAVFHINDSCEIEPQECSAGSKVTTQKCIGCELKSSSYWPLLHLYMGLEATCRWLWVSPGSDWFPSTIILVTLNRLPKFSKYMYQQKVRFLVLYLGKKSYFTHIQYTEWKVDLGKLLKQPKAVNSLTETVNIISCAFIECPLLSTDVECKESCDLCAKGPRLTAGTVASSIHKTN